VTNARSPRQQDSDAHRDSKRKRLAAQKVRALCNALAPWLGLANLIPTIASSDYGSDDRPLALSGWAGKDLGPFHSLSRHQIDEFRSQVTQAIGRFPLPQQERFEYLLRNDPLSPALVYAEALNAFAILSRISEWQSHSGDMPIKSLTLAPERLAVAVQAGRARFYGGLFSDFLLPLVDGIEAQRVRRCPTCRRIFCVLRSGDEFGSKACSKRCNDTRRTKKWRDCERVRAEQALRLSRKGKDLFVIAKKLGLGSAKRDIEKVRKYLSSMKGV
jgi:hypothetical protein